MVYNRKIACPRGTRILSGGKVYVIMAVSDAYATQLAAKMSKYGQVRTRSTRDEMNVVTLTADEDVEVVEDQFVKDTVVERRD